MVRESEEMEVRVMWKSDSNETRYNGRSAQGLKRKFGSASYMEFKAARNLDGIGRREEKYEKMDLISRVCLHLHLRSLAVR